MNKTREQSFWTAPGDCQKSLPHCTKSPLWRAFCDIKARVIKMLERSSDARNEISFFCIEDLVPKDHLLRKIEKAVDFNDIYPMVKQYYCQLQKTGCRKRIYAFRKSKCGDHEQTRAQAPGEFDTSRNLC